MLDSSTGKQVWITEWLLQCHSVQLEDCIRHGTYNGSDDWGKRAKVKGRSGPLKMGGRAWTSPVLLLWLKICLKMKCDLILIKVKVCFPRWFLFVFACITHQALWAVFPSHTELESVSPWDHIKSRSWLSGGFIALNWRHWTPLIP